MYAFVNMYASNTTAFEANLYYGHDAAAAGVLLYYVDGYYSMHEENCAIFI